MQFFGRKLGSHVGQFSVSVLLKDVRSIAEWVAMSVYGPATINEKVAFWQELSQVAGMWNCPWLIGGDFNAIRYPNEKRGGRAITL